MNLRHNRPMSPMNLAELTEYTRHLGTRAKTASALMAKAPAASKSQALKALARRDNTRGLKIDNARDLERARAAGLAAPMVERLQLSPQTLETCAQGCEQLAAMPDIIG